MKDAYDIVSQEITSLRRMVDNFSEFAKLPLPNPKPADVSELCRRVVELQKVAFTQHEIIYESDGESIEANVDIDLVNQVLINLVKNAAEACADTPSKIIVTARREGKVAVLKVKDNGPGIPVELQGRIFEAYFTTKHTGPEPGMGLGLAVCQKIIIDHGGEMLVVSSPGDTQFTLKLPLVN